MKNSTVTVPAPTAWDKIHHAPLCDDRTNEMLCIYLELVRIVASLPTPVIYKDTLEDFADYAVRRLNTLFGTGFELKRHKPAAEITLPNDSDLVGSGATVMR